MTSHEIASALLALPDRPVQVWDQVLEDWRDVRNIRFKASRLSIRLSTVDVPDYTPDGDATP